MAEVSPPIMKRLALRAAKSDLVQPELKLENQVGERVA